MAGPTQVFCLLRKGPLLLSGSQDSTIRLWDVHSGAQLDCWTRHTSWVSCLCADELHANSICSGGARTRLRGATAAPARTARGYRLHGAAGAPGVRFVDPALLRQHVPHAAAPRPIRARGGCAREPRDGRQPTDQPHRRRRARRLVCARARAGHDGTIRFWDLERRQQSQTIDFEGACAVHGSVDTDGAPGGQRYILTMQPFDERSMLVGSMDKTIRLLDLRTGLVSGAMRGHSSYVSCLLSLPGGVELLSASGDSQIRQWDLRTMSCVDIRSFHTDPVTCLRRRGSELISSSEVRAWPRRAAPRDVRGARHPCLTAVAPRRPSGTGAHCPPRAGREPQILGTERRAALARAR